VSGRTIDVVVEGIASPAWRRRLPRFCARALALIGARDWDVAVLLCGDERIQTLNATFRGKDKPTDVLSFPRSEDAGTDSIEGDLALCLDALRRNAARFGVSEDEEIKRLLVHGLLHLAGMDHGRGKGRRMLALQERLLRDLGEETIMGTA
jgi:probable rRNA maturation factor